MIAAGSSRPTSASAWPAGASAGGRVPVGRRSPAPVAIDVRRRRRGRRRAARVARTRGRGSARARRSRSSTWAISGGASRVLTARTRRRAARAPNSTCEELRAVLAEVRDARRPCGCRGATAAPRPGRRRRRAAGRSSSRRRRRSGPSCRATSGAAWPARRRVRGCASSILFVEVGAACRAASCVRQA